MKRKRFTINDCRVLSNKQILKILNSLIDENEQLKRKALDMEMDRDYYRTKSASLEEGYIRLQRENEQLKKSVKRQQGSNNECAKLIEEQQKENEHLKKEVHILKEYINKLLTKKYNHYEEMKKTIRNKEAQRIYTNILKVIKDLQEQVNTEWGN